MWITVCTCRSDQDYYSLHIRYLSASCTLRRIHLSEYRRAPRHPGPKRHAADLLVMTVRTSVDDSTELHLLGQSGARSDSSVNQNQLRGNGRSYVSSIFRHTFDTLRPDILTRRKGPAKPIGPTAWLDGLRGWAAFNVAIVHLTVYTHDWAELCYGIEVLPDYPLTSPIVMPFVRLIFSGGHFAVMLFFHISGYVLTRRLVSMMHEGPSRHDDVVDSVHSAIVRRPFRLFLPVVWSTLTWAIIWHVTGIAIPWPAKQSNIITELVCRHISHKVSFVLDHTSNANAYAFL